MVTVLAVVSYVLNPAQNDSYKVSAIDDIRCDKAPSYDFNINAHLDIFVEGKPQEIPSGIGIINNTCKYWIYTQDTTGIIHVDAPEEKQFTISQFFDIWKATTIHPPVGNPTIYINGQKTSSDLNSTAIKSHDEIVIIYGTMPSIIPEFYKFP